MDEYKSEDERSEDESDEAEKDPFEDESFDELLEKEFGADENTEEER